MKESNYVLVQKRNFVSVYKDGQVVAMIDDDSMLVEGYTNAMDYCKHVFLNK